MKEKTERAQGKRVAEPKPEIAEAVTPEQIPVKVKKPDFPKPCVYCGPSIRGIARQFTVYTGDIPEPLAEFVNKHPEVRGLMVSVGQFPITRQNLGRSGTVEAILYDKIKTKM